MAIAAMLIAGCGGSNGSSEFPGGGTGGYSDVSGTVSDINRNTITDATVWSDSDSAKTTKSLASGAYKLLRVESGWRNIKAKTKINGKTWVGSTAALVLKNEPTMNINITLSPLTAVTTISGVVKDDDGSRVSGARVLFTMRTVYPADQTRADDGSYGSIVAITNNQGQYTLKDVPVGVTGIVAASKVGFFNREYEIDTVNTDEIVNFTLVPASYTKLPYTPSLEYIESYTVPSSVSVASVDGNSDMQAYKAIKAMVSPRFNKAVPGKSVKTKMASTPAGSLIEIDLYWNAFSDNDSREVAGYGIYRTETSTSELRAIDFIRDPYANFYGDMGSEITPNQPYYYAVTAVDVVYLDSYGNFEDGAESDLSNVLNVRPLGQMSITSPNNITVSQNPIFSWNKLTNAAKYRVLVFDKFPAYSIVPIIDRYETGYTYSYTGSALKSGGKYYWVVLASDSSGRAFSYSKIYNFDVQ